MIKRLATFLKSRNKQVMLKYFLHEQRASAARLYNSFLRSTDLFNRRYPGKINLAGQNSRLYGLHRSGWNYAMQQLGSLHNPKGILLDAFVDQTFSGGRRGFKGYSEPWIGFIHVPPGVPGWMQSKQSNEAIFHSEGWKRSAPYCRGLYTLSRYHGQFLQPQFDFPVESLLHPVQFPEMTWNFEKFAASRDKMIIQSGWWLRRVCSIYLLEVEGYTKVILMKEDAGMEQQLKLEMEHMDGSQRITRTVLESVQRMKFLSNKRYDRLLSENILFLDLIDASANNAIVECIARNTPVLVNPIPPVVEYLGAGYPFYFRSLGEAAKKAENIGLVRETHEYLVNYPLKRKLSGDYFRQSFTGSSIYRSL